MRITLVFTLLVIVGFLYCSTDKSLDPIIVNLDDLHPKDNEINGWRRTGQHWSVTKSEDLSIFINGEAVLYTERGFREGGWREYIGKVGDDSLIVDLRIFDQGSPANADSVFTELSRLMGNPIDWSTGSGKAAKIERYDLSQRLIFWKSKYFISVLITSGLDDALDVIKQFANTIDSKI